ncbi:MAG: hypothetical protein GSR84_08950 [Desulfurococcales archaeon]|nr:hypothetical protein [Desulfurococcales archaeon]
MGEPRFVIRCYHADGSFDDMFSDECVLNEEPAPGCVRVECMSLSEWFEEDCEATDFPGEEEECLDMLDEAGAYVHV